MNNYRCLRPNPSVFFEITPIWILAMRPDICHTIYVPNCESFVDLNTILDNYKIDKTLYHLVIDFVGAHRFRFSEPNDDVLYLVSGSISFLNDIPLLIRQKRGIFITDKHQIHRRGLPNTNFTSHRCKHTMVGGATTFEGVYGYLDSTMTPKFSNLRRNLGDYMDYAIPPSTIKTSQLALCFRKLAPISHIHRLVYYPSPFSSTDFGYRSLRGYELATLFGFDMSLTPKQRS